jgi:hypothetical protein
MGNIGKRYSLLLLMILAVSSLILVESTSAQSIPKPSVPEFTVKYVDNSYDVAPTYGTDPYTGKNVVTEVGYHVQNKSIKVWVSNQAFSNYRDTSGNRIMLYYDIQWKGHFVEYWRNSNTSFNGLHLVASSSLLANNELVSPNAPFTIITIGFIGNNGSTPYSMQTDDVSAGGQIDFQVQAFIGYYTTLESTPDPLFFRTHTIYTFHGETSDWSNTQTISIPDGAVSTSTSPSPTPTLTSNPTPTLTVPEFSWLAIIPLMISMLSVTLAFRRHRKTSTFKQLTFSKRAFRKEVVQKGICQNESPLQKSP